MCVGTTDKDAIGSLPSSFIVVIVSQILQFPDSKIAFKKRLNSADFHLHTDEFTNDKNLFISSQFVSLMHILSLTRDS